MKKTQSNITILLLAAGNSSRLGRPKQLLKWKKANLLQHAINCATYTIAQKTILILGAHFDEIISKINASKTTIYQNTSWINGLGNSIAFGIQKVMETNPKTDAVLIMLADQPLINPNYLNKMISLFKKDNEQIITSSYLNKKFGVPTIFDKAYFNELLQLNNDEGAKQVIKNHLKSIIIVKQDYNFEDIDTEEDYLRLYNANH